MKEKTLMKLERDKLSKKSNNLSDRISEFETKATRLIEMENAKRTKKIQK